MLRICKGNLLTAGFDVIAHQVNCQSVMGAGLALQVKTQFPGSFEAYVSDMRAPEEKLGTFIKYKTEIESPLYIYHLYGQLKYGRGKCFTDYTALTTSFFGMIKDVKTIEATMNRQLKIGIPYGIGCGLAGGEWMLVRDMLEFISKSTEMHIHLCKL